MKAMIVKRLLGKPSGGTWLWRSIALLLAGGFFLSGCVVATEEPTPPETTLPVDDLVEEQETKSPVTTNSKLDSSLNQLLDAYRNDGMAEAQSFATAHGIVLEGDSVQVVIVTAPQAIDKLTETVISLGGEVQGYYKGQLQALVPIDSMASLAAQQDVQRIREPSRPIP